MDSEKVWAVSVAIIFLALFSFLTIAVIQVQESKREFAKQGLQYKVIPTTTYALRNWVKD